MGSTAANRLFTASYILAQQAEVRATQQAVIRKWAKDMDVTLTEEDQATLQAQKDAYGEDLQRVLKSPRGSMMI